MTNGNDLAYPSETQYRDSQGMPTTEQHFEWGLSKREYFAAMAMQGILANPIYHDNTVGYMVEMALDSADTLIAELNKEVAP